MTYKACPTCGNTKKMSGVYKCVRCKKIICAKCGADRSHHPCGTSGGEVLGTIG